MNLEELDTYRLAEKVSDDIWKAVESWTFYQKDTIGKQLVRSIDSISANISEGYGRYFFKENRQFCYYARGSLLESKTWINKAKRRSLILPDDANVYIEQLEIIHKKLNAYIRSIGPVS